jgi:hypothetical protein
VSLSIWVRLNRDFGAGGVETGAELAENKFMSIDPAPSADALLPEEHHISCLLDSSLSLFQRYGSLFALRDRGTSAAVLGLCKALLEDTSSALLRHEIAFVLGQLQNKAALPALEASLRNTAENQVIAVGVRLRLAERLTIAWRTLADGAARGGRGGRCRAGR